MDPSISKAAIRKAPAKTPSATTEAEHSRKRFKTHTGVSPTRKGPELETPYADKKRFEDATELHDEGSSVFSMPGDSVARLVEVQISGDTLAGSPDVALEKFEQLISSEMKKLEELNLSRTQQLAMGARLNIVQIKAGLHLLYSQAEREKDEFKKAKAAFEATISGLKRTISNLEAEMTLNSNNLAEAEAEAKQKSSELSLVLKLAEAEAKLKMSELSHAHLNSRVESLEAELIRKHVENEVLKNQVVASEQKASIAEQKALSLEKKLIELG